MHTSQRQRDKTCGNWPKITTIFTDKTADYKLTVKTCEWVFFVRWLWVCVCLCEYLSIDLNTVPKRVNQLIHQFRLKSSTGCKDKVIAVFVKTKQRQNKNVRKITILNIWLKRELTFDLAFHESRIHFSLAIKMICFCWQFKKSGRQRAKQIENTALDWIVDISRCSGIRTMSMKMKKKILCFHRHY